MAIFDKRYTDVLFEEELPEVPEQDFESDTVENELDDVKDSELAVIEAFHAIDMAEINGLKKINALREEAEETGEDKEEEIEEVKDEMATVTEGAVSNAWEKIKEWVKKIFAIIFKWIETAIAFFAKFLMTNKQFAKTYEPKVKKLDLKGFKYDMYEYPIAKNIKFDMDTTTDVFTTAVGSNASTGQKETNAADLLLAAGVSVKGLVNKFMDKSADLNIDATANSELNLSSDVKKAIRDAFRGEKKEQEFDHGYVFGILLDESPVKAFKEFKKAANNKYKSIIGDIKKEETKVAGFKNAEDATEESKALVEDMIAVFKTGISAIQKLQNTQIAIANIWKSIAVERCNVCKSVVVKALTYKPEK